MKQLVLRNLNTSIITESFYGLIILGGYRGCWDNPSIMLERTLAVDISTVSTDSYCVSVRSRRNWKGLLNIRRRRSI